MPPSPRAPLVIRIPVPGNPGRVVLHELHVLERYARAICHGRAVGGLDRAIGGERKDTPGATGRDDDSPRMKSDEPTGADFNCDRTGAAFILDYEIGGVVLVEPFDRWMDI